MFCHLFALTEQQRREEAYIVINLQFEATEK